MPDLPSTGGWEEPVQGSCVHIDKLHVQRRIYKLGDYRKVDFSGVAL